MLPHHHPNAPAIFLDRDGTIIEDRGYISLIDDVIFYPFAIRALGLLQKKFLLFIVTNQTGVGIGRISREAVHDINLHIMSHLQKNGITIQQTYSCFHTKDENCECIKPKPYFIRKAESDYGVDPSHSFTIGDHPHDVEFGAAAGATGLYLLSGHGKKHLGDVPGGTVCFENLLKAAEWIFSRYGR